MVDMRAVSWAATTVALKVLTSVEMMAALMVATKAVTMAGMMVERMVASTAD